MPAPASVPIPSSFPRPAVVRQEDNFKILCYAATVPTSWTTVYPRSGQTNDRIKTSVTFASFKSTSSTDITIKLRLLDPSGTAIESLPQGQLVESGERFEPFNLYSQLEIEPGWSLQVLGDVSSAAWSMHGIERWLPS